MTGLLSELRGVYGLGWLAGDGPSTGGVLNITAAAWTVGFHWWHSGNIMRMQNVSEYMLVLALCLIDYETLQLELNCLQMSMSMSL